MSKIRVGLVGLGVGTQHLEAYLQAPDKFDLSLLCDLDAARAAPHCARAGARYTSSLDELINDKGIDLVDICLPPRLHKAAIIKSLQAGKHVICEKPLVDSLADIDEVKAVVEATGYRVFPVFQYRFGAGLGQLLELQAKGITGTPLVATLETHWNRGADYYDVDWRGKWHSELGGVLVTHAIHSHDLLSCVMGRVVSVQAMLDTRVNPIEVEDCAALVLKTENGALCTSSVTLGNAVDQSRLRFVFAGVSAESCLDPYKPATTPWTFTARGPTAQSQVDTIVSSYREQKEGYAGLFDDIFASIWEHRAANVELADARRSLELITALYSAARNGKTVDLPLAADHPGYQGWQPR